MGADKSKTQTAEFEIAHPKFSNSKLIKDQQVRIETLHAIDENRYKQWDADLQKLKPQRQHLLLPVQKKFASKGLCGSSGIATLQYDYFPYLLSEQIDNRNKSHVKFEETDLWYLLYSLSSAKNLMWQRNLPVGDIRPENIFLNDEGNVKIANRLSWPDETPIYEKVSQKEHIYLAPQQLEKVQKGQMEDDEQDSQSEIFAIGLTMINAGLLKDDHTLYDVKDNKFNANSYDNRIKDWILTRGFSDVLKATVLNLISLNPAQRLTADELWSFLSKHERKIESRENFLIDNAPGKIHSEVEKFREARKALGSKIPLETLPVLNSSVVVKHETVHSNNQPQQRTYEHFVPQRSNEKEYSEAKNYLNEAVDKVVPQNQKKQDESK